MIDDLYSAKVLALAANMPRAGRLPEPQGSSEKVSKLCGSRITVDVVLTDGRVTDFAQDVKACALGQASAAVLGEHVIGASVTELEAARDALKAMLKTGGAPPEGRFADLKVLAVVKDYPPRHASTMLAFEAVVEAAHRALAEDLQSISPALSDPLTAGGHGVGLTPGSPMPMSASTPYAGANRRRSLFLGWLIVALAIFAALAAATLCPIQWRPRLSDDPNAERFWAFFLLGIAAKFAVPRRHLPTLVIVALMAFGTEAMQLIVPGRHARLPDGMVKALGAVAGVMAGYAFFKLRRLWRTLAMTDGQGGFLPN